MIKQLSVFTSEVTRVAREVGTEGKLGGQAQVIEVTGVWKELTESVNSMANNLTAQVRNIAEVTIAVANGDLSKKITVDVRGEILQLKEAINTMVDQLRSFASEVTRVAREVGTEGKLGGQAIVPGVAGTWKDLTDSVNAMCGNLTDQVRTWPSVSSAEFTPTPIQTRDERADLVYAVKIRVPNDKGVLKIGMPVDVAVLAIRPREAAHATDAVVVERLAKRFGTTTALDGVSFDVRAGELFGFIGPDGARQDDAVPHSRDAARARRGHAPRVLGLDVVQRPLGAARSASATCRAASRSIPT